MENKKKPAVIKKEKQDKIYIKPEKDFWGGDIEYLMPAELYRSLAAECRKTKAGELQHYLCNYVNEQCGLLGACVRVICSE